MFNCNKKILKDESGAVAIVEAAFVYPIVIFVVIIFLMLGNVFYQQSRVDSVAVRAAEKLASYYTNPLLMKDGLPTNSENITVYPYRYLLGDAGAVAGTKKFIDEELSKIGSGLFSGMEINAKVKTCQIKNYIVYQNASVAIEYTIDFYPMKLIGGIPLLKQNVASSTSAADPAEFIRNVDMIMDYAQKADLGGKLEKVKEFLGN